MAKAPAPPRRAKPVDTSAPPSRSTLTFRLRNEVRRDVERAAARYGRSLSEEIETRLEVSFAFTQYIKQEWGDDVFRIAQAMAASLSHIEDWTGKEWIKDEETCDLFEITASNIIRNYRDLVTKAAGRAWPQGDLEGKTHEELGQMFAAIGGLAPPRLKKPAVPAEASDEQIGDRSRSMASMKAMLAEEGE